MDKSTPEDQLKEPKIQLPPDARQNGACEVNGRKNSEKESVNEALDRNKSRSRELRFNRKRKLSEDGGAKSRKKVKRTNKEEKAFEKSKKILDRKHVKKTRSRAVTRAKSPRKKEEAEPGKLTSEDYNKQLDYLARFGKNFYCPSLKQRTGLRPIYIDGSNVAYSHGQNERFSVEGLKICIDYFRKRGHEVKAFVPHFRLRRGETTDQSLLHKLVTKKFVITTPTLYIQNQRRNPYDDWYIIQTAAANGGIIVSSDNFQDIAKWNPNLRSVIEERRLVPTFVDDMLIFPVDPHGNRQNNLEQFLRFEG